MSSEPERGATDPMVDALVASARRLGSEAEAEPPAVVGERQTRIWTSVTRVTATGVPSAAAATSWGGWLWAVVLAAGCAGVGAAVTWLLLR